jgi:hypothetical protein
MPFQSEKQRRFLWAEHPDIAKRWAHEYPNKKKLPMYAHDNENVKSPNKGDNKSQMKQSALAVLHKSLSIDGKTSPGSAESLSFDIRRSFFGKLAQDALMAKKSESILGKLCVPHNDKPVAAGDEHVEFEGKGEKTEQPQAFNPNAPEIKPIIEKFSALFNKYAAVIRLGKKMQQRMSQAQQGPQPNNVGLDIPKLQRGIDQYRQQRAWAQQQAMMFPPAGSDKKPAQPAPVASYPGTSPQQGPQIASNATAEQSAAANPIGLKGPLNTDKGVPTFAQNLTGNASFGAGSA